MHDIEGFVSKENLVPNISHVENNPCLQENGINPTFLIIGFNLLSFQPDAWK
jgi:hypothetical protein